MCSLVLSGSCDAADGSCPGVHSTVACLPGLDRPQSKGCCPHCCPGDAQPYLQYKQRTRGMTSTYTATLDNGCGCRWCLDTCITPFSCSCHKQTASCCDKERTYHHMVPVFLAVAGCLRAAELSGSAKYHDVSHGSVVAFACCDGYDTVYGHTCTGV